MRPPHPRFTLLILLALLTLCFWKWSSSKKPPPSSQEESAVFSKIVERKNNAQSSKTSSAVASGALPPSPQRLELAVPDLDPIFADAQDRDRKKLPFRFATPLEVNKTSSELSPWQFHDGLASWELEVHAADALSLNFAFDQFHMPPGGVLSLQSNESDQVITFTSKDNDDHGELWTPLFRGDTVRLTASLPAVLLSDLRLNLAKVNYGFRNNSNDSKIGGSSSGNCNVDVVCDASDGSFADMIDNFREQIRSVAAYTINGVDTCTGALINNTNFDNTPYFLTAAHCGITTANDASIVVFWNFENSSCRIPNTTASGGVGDGDTDVFNSGAIRRALSDDSDFCLIELDDPVNPDSKAFLSGWNRSSTAPNQAVAIHHPAVAEKRISFEFNPLTITNDFSDSSTSSGSFLRVADWDVGTTEGGSSGSPLFNSSGQIVGQLLGGGAACGNNQPDWYGGIFASWTGGGTASTRLSNWLAPTGNAPTSLAGKELSIVIQANDIAIMEGDSGTQTATVNFELSSPADIPITFTVAPSGGTASPASDFTDPGAQTLTLSPSQTSISLDFAINGDTLPEENETILLTVSNVTGASASPEPIIIVIANDDFVTPVISGNLALTGNEGTVLSEQIEADNTPITYAISGQPSGLTLDPTSGLLTWETPIFGDYSFTISATNPAGTGSATFSLSVGASLLKPAFEVPNQVAIGGDLAEWRVTTTETFDGEDALILTDAPDNSLTQLTFSVVGPDELTFWWKASTGIGDFFDLILDGSRVAFLNGESDWHPFTLSIPAGTHTVAFDYSRINNFSGGLNEVGLDRFTLESLSLPAFEQGADLFVEQGEEVALELSTVFPSTPTPAPALPSGWSLTDGNFITGLFESALSFSISADNEQGTSTRAFTLTPFSSVSSLEAALDLNSLPVRSPSPSFFPQSTIRTTGSNAPRSADIDDNGRSEMTATVIGPGTLTFQWQVSSEESFDFGYVLLNGEQVAVESGDTGWLTLALPLTDKLYEVTWLYVKDGSVSDLSDALFVDNVRLDGYAQWVFDNGMSPFSLPIGSGIDGDRNPALLEYAVGLSPVDAEPGHLLDLTGNPSNWNLSTPVNSSALGLTLTIEKSNTLEPDSWTALGSDSSPLGSILSFPDSSGDSKAFYRLNVTTP